MNIVMMMMVVVVVVVVMVVVVGMITCQTVQTIHNACLTNDDGGVIDSDCFGQDNDGEGNHMEVPEGQ